MKKIWILLVVVLVALFFGFREGFETTGPVPPPNPARLDEPYRMEQLRALYNRLPREIRGSYEMAETMRVGGTAEQAIARVLPTMGFAAGIVYESPYKTATAPLTAADVTAAVKRSAIPPNAPNGQQMIIYETMKLLFVGRPPPARTTQTGRPLPPPPGTRVPPKKADTMNDNVWGPRTTGLGTPRNFGSVGDGDGQYPTLLGPPRKTSGYMTGVGVLGDKPGADLPSSASLGSDPLSGFLPFSRQPGDQELIADPYRVAQSYSASSYSSKNEPVPFLTDFSAFQ